MSLREELLEYMNRTEPPEELSPEGMAEKLFPSASRPFVSEERPPIATDSEAEREMRELLSLSGTRRNAAASQTPKQEFASPDVPEVKTPSPQVRIPDAYRKSSVNPPRETEAPAVIPNTKYRMWTDESKVSPDEKSNARDALAEMPLPQTMAVKQTLVHQPDEDLLNVPAAAVQEPPAKRPENRENQTQAHRAYKDEKEPEGGLLNVPAAAVLDSTAKRSENRENQTPARRPDTGAPEPEENLLHVPAMNLPKPSKPPQKQELPPSPQNKAEVLEQAKVREQALEADSPRTPSRRIPESPVEIKKTGTPDSRDSSKAPEGQTEQKSQANQAFTLDARAFIKIVQSQKMTGKEFLQLIGNSRISNKAYLEIEQNPTLTQKRLIEILEVSGLTSEDYEKLLIAVNKRAKLKQEAIQQLKAREEKERRMERDAERFVRAAENRAARETVRAAEKEEKEGEELKDALKWESTARDEASRDQPLKFSSDITGKQEDQSANFPQPVQLRSKVEEDDIRPYEKKEESDNPSEKSDEEDEDREDYYDEPETGKISAVFALAVLLFIISFALRYYYTGSFLIPSEEEKEEITTPQQLYSAMEGLGRDGAGAVREELVFSAGLAPRSEEKPMPSASNGDYLLICNENTLYIAETVGGQMKPKNYIQYNGNLEGVILYGDDFYAVSREVGVSVPFSYRQPVEGDSEAQGEAPVINDVLTRDFVVIQKIDGQTGEVSGEYRQSGESVDIFFYENEACVLTYENIANNAAAPAEISYMPQYGMGEELELLSTESVYLPEGAEYGSFLSIGMVNFPSGICNLSALAGGEGQTVFPRGDKLFITQNNDGNTLLLKYDLTVPSQPAAVKELSGLSGAYTGLDVSGDMVRLTTLLSGEEAGNQGGISLWLLDGDMEIISSVDGLGRGEEPVSSCYDKSGAYIITKAGENQKLYGVNTSEPEAPVLMNSVNTPVTSRKCRQWAEDVMLTLTVQTGADGEREGLVLSTVYDNGTVIDSAFITAESSVAGDWNKYLSSAAEEDPMLIRGETENGFVALPVTYFDGVSQVERILVFKVDENWKLERAGGIIEYDLRSSFLLSETNGKFYYCIFGDTVISANSEDNKIISEMGLSSYTTST